MAIAEGKTVRRAKVGHKSDHGKGPERAEDVGEVGTVTRVLSWKWIKIDINGSAWWVRAEEFEEV